MERRSNEIQRNRITARGRERFHLSSAFPFGDDGLGGVGVNVHPAEIKPLEVTALAHHVEPGVVAKPLVLPVVQVVVLGRSPRAARRSTRRWS